VLRGRGRDLSSDRQGGRPRAPDVHESQLGSTCHRLAGRQDRQGEGSVWKVVEDASAPSKTGYALAQTAKGPSPLFNLCVVQEGTYRDPELRVSFKAVAGETDQGGGFVWRYRDADNYYVARYNPLENNYRFYKVVGGKRTQLATKEGVKAPAGSWHTLAVKMTGDRVECYLNDKLHLETKDATFAEPGKVGLWTKADAQTHFDLFQVKELAK
jgi:hypothetical protein